MEWLRSKWIDKKTMPSIDSEGDDKVTKQWEERNEIKFQNYEVYVKKWSWY